MTGSRTVPNSVGLSAATFTIVPDDGYNHDTIQAAIDAAQPGDTIEVAEGAYNEHLVIITDDLVIRSTGGREVTFITGTHTSFPWLPESVQ